MVSECSSCSLVLTEAGGDVLAKVHCNNFHCYMYMCGCCAVDSTTTHLRHTPVHLRKQGGLSRSIQYSSSSYTPVQAVAECTYSQCLRHRPGSAVAHWHTKHCRHCTGRLAAWAKHAALCKCSFNETIKHTQCTHHTAGQTPCCVMGSSLLNASAALHVHCMPWLTNSDVSSSRQPQAQ